MIIRNRNACGRAVACLSLLAAPMLASAIDSPFDAIATPAYQKSMRTQAMMDKIDANGDHMVSRAEGEAYFGKLFDILDKNHDGSLDRTEWVGAETSKEVVSVSDGGYARALGSMDMMAMVDADGDHKVSKAEFLKAHDAMFDKMAGGESAIDAQHFLADHFPK